MASRVNTKFVIVLVGVLFVLFAGVAGLAVVAKLRSGGRLISQGDAAMAAGDYTTAAKKYARAVGKDQSRVDWLDKWRDALLKTVPDNSANYQKAYKEHYMGILSQLAALSPTDPQAQLDFVKEFDEYLRMAGGGSLSGFQQIESLVDERVAQLDPEDPKTKELLAYRGRAIVDQMLRVNVDQDKVDQAKKDLTGALEVNPKDYDSALALAQWYYAKVEQARRDVRPTDADAANKEFQQQLAKTVERFGDVPEVRVFAFRVEALDAGRTVVSPEDRRKMQEALRPDAKATLDALAAADAGALDTQVLNQAARVVVGFVGDEGQDEFVQMMRRVVDSRPDDPDALIMLGQSLSSKGKFAEAYDVFDKVVQLPDKPVSLEGMMLPEYRRVAVQYQVDMLLAQYEQADSKEKKDELLTQAKARRDVLQTMTDVNSEDELKLRNARIAYIEGDNAQTIVLLEEIRRNMKDDNPLILRLLGLSLMRQGNLGDAVRQFEKLASGSQASATDFSYIGDIYLQLGDTDKSIAAYQDALRINPGYKYAQQRIDAIKQATGAVAGGGMLDPIIEALVSAQKLSSEGDTEGAIKVLEEAHAKHPDDPRIIRELAARYVGADRRPDAIALVEGALKRRPDDADLKALDQQVTIADPVKAAEAIIDSLQNLTPVQKAIQRFYVYDRYQQKDKADAAFAEAERLDPDNPAVIELGFLRALSLGTDAGYEKAAAYATRAAEQNVDRVGGLTFKGRLELAKGDSRNAEATLQRAVDRNQFDPMSRRWLGQAQRQNGKVDAALQSFERAYQGRPGHTGIAEDYARALVVAGQGPKALEVIQKAVASSDRSPRLMNFWLDLEAQYGDREKALDNRRKLFEANVADLQNSIAYLNLLIEDKKFDDFETAMTTLEKSDTFTPLQIVGLRARSLAEQGKVEEGRAVLVDFVKALPDDKREVEDYMTLGGFERQYGTPDAAAAAYEQAKPYENDKLREADRALGDLHFGAGQSLLAQGAGAKDATSEARAQVREHFQKAADAYERVHDADPSDSSVAKRYAETLIRLDRYEDAKAVLNSVGNDEDLQVILLRSLIAQTGGDIRAARDLLNRAVELYPNDPIPFYRRADLNKSDEALFPDVIADLDQATKLRPGMIEAWTLRFQLYQARDQMDQAFAQLRSAINANPDNDSLKRLLVRDLVGAGRMDEAKAEVQKIADANKDNTVWQQDAAIISYRQGSFDDARKYYARLYEIDADPLTAADLLNAWFRANSKPELPDVNRLLRKVKEIDLASPADSKNAQEKAAAERQRVVTQMLMARAHQFLGEKADADKNTFGAYEDAKKASPIALRIWFDDLVERFHTKDTDGSKEAFAYLKDHPEQFKDLPPILEVLVIRNDMISGTPLPKCAERLEAMADQCKDDPYNKLEFARLQNQIAYAMGDYEKCAEACKTGLSVSPTDLELNNNLAYVLAKHLNQPEKAMPYAEAAAQAAPLNAAVLDTLGWVYFESGRYRDADRVLQRSVTTSKAPDELVPAYLHLAQTKKATGDLNEAKKYIIQASEQLKKANQMIKDQYGQEVKSLFDELAGGSGG